MELECLVPKNTENRPTMGSGDRWRNVSTEGVSTGRDIEKGRLS